MAQEKIVVFNITNQTTEEAVVFSAQMYDWKIEWLEGKLEMAEGKEVVKLPFALCFMNNFDLLRLIQEAIMEYLTDKKIIRMQKLLAALSGNEAQSFLIIGLLPILKIWVAANRGDGKVEEYIEGIGTAFGAVMLMPTGVQKQYSVDEMIKILVDAYSLILEGEDLANFTDALVRGSQRIQNNQD